MKKFFPLICLALASCNHDTSDRYLFNRVSENSVDNYNFNESMNRDRDGYAFSRTPVGLSAESAADWAITFKVKNAILADPSISLSANLVHVKTSNGVVTLSGTLPSRDDIDKVARKAKEVQGVKKIINQMKVAR